MLRHDFEQNRSHPVCPNRERLKDLKLPFRHRLSQYHDKTEPLVAYYEEQGLLKRVNGDQEPEVVSDQIRKLLATLAMEEEA